MSEKNKTRATTDPGADCPSVAEYERRRIAARDAQPAPKAKP